MNVYGKELILDLEGCDPTTFNRDIIGHFFDSLCRRIEMQPCERHFWDDLDVPEEEKQTEPHLKGTSAVQFIMTSNITIHTLDLLRTVYLNVFSCKDFDSEIVKEETIAYFGGKVISETSVARL